MSNRFKQIDPAEAGPMRILARLAMAGLSESDVERYAELARDYPDEAAELGDPFAAEPGRPTWSCGIDVDRWLALGLRERAEGLGEVEARELLDYRKRWREVLESGGLPGGRRYYVQFPKVRRLGGGTYEDEEPAAPRYPCGIAELDLARLAEVVIRSRTGDGCRAQEVDDYRLLSLAYPLKHRWLEQLFGRLQVDNSWMTGVDFDRWEELLMRLDEEGLTRAEGEELRGIIGTYREEMWSGRHPSGHRIKVSMVVPTIRYKDGEEG